MIFLAIIAGVIMFFGLMVFVFTGLLSSESKNAQRNKDTIIQETFSGAPLVTYKVSKIGGGTLTMQQMLEGAQSYGYELHAQSEQQYLTELVFKRIHAPIPPPPGI